MFSPTGSMTPPPAVSGPGSFPGATSAPSPSGKAPWPGGGTVASHHGRPHMAGHLNHPPAFSGHSPFDGNVGIDHSAVSQLNRQNFALRNETQHLREENCGLARTAHELSARPDISHQALGELREAAHKGLQMEQRAARSQDRAIAAEENAERMTLFMEPVTEELRLGAAEIRELKQHNKEFKAENTRLNTSLHQVTTELEKTISQLSEKLSEIDTLNSQLKKESFDNRALQEQLETVTQEACTAQSLVDELRLEKHDLEKQLVELGRAKDGQDWHIRCLNQDVQTGKDALKREQSTSMELEKQLLSLKSSESQLQTQLNTTESRLQESQDQLVDSERSLRGTQEKLGDTQIVVERLSRELSQIKVENRENKAYGKEVQAKLRKYVQITDSLKADLAKSERSVATLTQEVSEKTDEVKVLRLELQESQKKVAALENTIHQQRSELVDMHRLEAELNTVREDNASLDQRNQDLNSELSDVFKREQNLRHLHDGAISEKRTLEQTLKTKEQLIARHESSIQERESRIEHLHSELRGLQKELETAKSEGNQEIIEQLRGEIAGKDQKISELQSMQRSSQSDIDQLNDQITDPEIRLHDSDQLSNERAATLERQKHLMQEGEVRIKQLNAQVADFSEELASVQEGIQTLRGEYTLTRNILDQNLDSLASCQEIARQLDEIVSHPNPEAASLLSQLQQHISGVTGGFTLVAENLQRDSAKLDSLQSRTDGLEESDRGTMLRSTGGTIGKGLLSGTDSTVLHSQSRTVEDGSRTDSPRPGHLPTDYSESGALSGRQGDGFGSSSDDGVRRHPEHQGFPHASSNRATMDLLGHDLGGDDESHASLDPSLSSLSSLRGRDTMDLGNRPFSDDSDSD